MNTDFSQPDLLNDLQKGKDGLKLTDRLVHDAPCAGAYALRVYQQGTVLCRFRLESKMTVDKKNCMEFKPANRSWLETADEK
jgi:hypothetical protein